MIKEKISRCWENEITPILCIGESLKIREKGIEEIKKHLFSQLEETLNFNDNFQDIIIAYEPIWAIGTGNTATINDIIEMCDCIFSALNSLIPNKNNIPRCLYGGSVNNSNAKDILSISNIGGVLVGGASLDSTQFSKIINSI